MFEPIFPEISEHRRANLSKEAYQKAAPFSPKEWVVYYIQGRPGGLPQDTVKALRLFLLSYETMYLVHLPDIITENLKEQISYNFPWVDTSVEDITEMAFYRSAAKRIGVNLDNEHGYFVRYNPASDDMDFVMVSGDTPEDLIPQLESFLSGTFIVKEEVSLSFDSFDAEYVDRSIAKESRFDSKCEDFYFDELPQLKRSSKRKSVSHSLINAYKDVPVKEDSNQTFLSTYSKYGTPADDMLLEDIREVEEKTHELIKTLLMNNFSREVIMGWLYENVIISDIVITPSYKIFLPQYNNKEIKLTPLEKTIWLFYIKHPEGVAFKDLPSHEKEMMSIYEKLAKRDDIESMKTSINDLCNPYKDSISQKVAKVRGAFVAAMPDEIAKNYYISGPIGYEKRIPLDRAKVRIEAKL